MASIRTVLKLNAASCLLFGLGFLIFPGAVAAFLGAPPAPPTLILALGAGLVLNGGLILTTARKDAPSAGWVAFFALGDGLWVLGTLVLILSGLWITSTAGIAAAIAVAAMVGLFGLMQFRHVRCGAGDAAAS